jgi:hypothetical protein
MAEAARATTASYSSTRPTRNPHLQGADRGQAEGAAASQTPVEQKLQADELYEKRKPFKDLVADDIEE